MGLFGSGTDDTESEKADQQRRQINQLNNRIEALQQNIDKLNTRIGQIEDHLQELDQSEDYDIDQLEDELHTTERSLRGSISAVREQLKDLDSRVEDDYQPRLEQEQDLLKDITNSLSFIRQRLSTYGTIRQDVRDLSETVDSLDAQLNGKVGHTAFEEFQRETREKIKRLKSRLDRLE